MDDKNKIIDVTSFYLDKKNQINSNSYDGYNKNFDKKDDFSKYNLYKDQSRSASSDYDNQNFSSDGNDVIPSNEGKKSQPVNDVSSLKKPFDLKNDSVDNQLNYPSTINNPNNQVVHNLNNQNQSNSQGVPDLINQNKLNNQNNPSNQGFNNINNQNEFNNPSNQVLPNLNSYGHENFSKSSPGQVKNLKQEAAKRTLSKINPALNAALNSKVGQKLLNNNLSKGNKSTLPDLNKDTSSKDDKPSNDEQVSDVNEKSSGKSSFQVITGFKPKTVAVVFIAMFSFLPVILIILIVSSVGIVKPATIDVSKENINVENLDSSDVKIDDVKNQTEKQAYIDIYDSTINEESVNVFLVASHSELNVDLISDFFDGGSVCGSDNRCSNFLSKRFYTKLYDIYYLYLTKYNVKLDIPLLMSTLFYRSDDFNYLSYLSNYDRQLIVESDWNPSSVTELDWDYDYESKNNYLAYNDSSLDLQVLSKNMVVKITTQSCVKDNNTIKTAKVKDYEPDLVCDEGEELVKGSSTYELDLDKYDDFLSQYIEIKYYIKKIVPLPLFSVGPDYETDKVPSIINRRKKSTSSASKSDVSSENVISRLTDIARGEVGNDGSEYLNYFNAGNDNWCGYFVSWLFEHVNNEENKYIVANGGAGEIPRATLRQNLGGTWLEDECTDSSSVPKEGDLILFDPEINGVFTPYPQHDNDKFFSSHIGYVYKVDDTYVYTVEGNSGGMVREKSYDRKSYCGKIGLQGINGYFRPDYSKGNSTSSDNNMSSSSDDRLTNVNLTGGFKNKIFYYYQYDYNEPYGDVYGATIGSHGCGPTSLAIAISSILHEKHDPVELTNYMCENYSCTNSGSAWEDISKIEADYANKYGFKSASIGDLDELRTMLSGGNALAVTITNGGFYTNAGNLISSVDSGHYFVLSGVADNGDIYIVDPANPNNTGRTINLEKLAEHNHNSIEKPSFWVIYK